MIARRLLENRGFRLNPGAALLAQALSQMHDRVGDGTAAAAVMFQSVFDGGLRFVLAGGNPMILRQYLEAGQAVILDQLRRQRFPLAGKATLTRFAATLSPDEPLAAYMGEIFDVIGEFGRLEIIDGQAKELRRDYVEGMYWDKGLVSPYMANHPTRIEAHLETPAIFLSNYWIEEPRHIAPVLEGAIECGFKSLLIVSTGFSEKVIGLLTNPANRAQIEVAAVTPDVYNDDRQDFIEDLAALTGAVPFWRASDLESELVFSTVRNLETVKAEHYGRARRVWATTSSVGIIGARGDPKFLRQYIADLRQRHDRATDALIRQSLRQRIGKLMGGSATLMIGGSNPIQMRQRKEQAERLAPAMRSALRSGAVPGGGAALLACRAGLEERRRAAVEPEERAAYHLLAEMVREPARVLLRNCGQTTDLLLEQASQAGAGFGVDALRGEAVRMVEAGILDSAAVLEAAVQTAISAAGLALTLGAVVPARKS
jgi:chaperonin GroEL